MTPRKPHLRPVAPGEAPPPPKAPKTITEALDGDSRDVLVAMRHALAKKLDAGEVSSNAIASAYKELRELDRLIRAEDRALEAEQEAERAAQGISRRSFDASAI